MIELRMEDTPEANTIDAQDDYPLDKSYSGLSSGGPEESLPDQDCIDELLVAQFSRKFEIQC